MASKLNPPSQYKSWDRVGAPPAIQKLLLILDEFIDPAQTVVFQINYENTSVEWLAAPYNPYGYINYDPNTNYGELQLVLQNTQQLSNGTYRATVAVDLLNSEGALIRTLSATIDILLSGTEPNQVMTDKINYNVFYNRETDTLSGETHVAILNNTAPDPILFETVGALFQELTAVDEFALVEDPAFPFATNPELPESGSKVVTCRLKQDAVYVHTFTVTIVVVADNEIFVDPDVLDFILRKGFNETQTQNLQIINPMNLDFTITGPDWLNFSVASGNASATIAVTTDNSETVAVGTFSGNIEIAYDGKVLPVPVSLLVTEFISIPDKNFCLDGIILSATQQHEEARIVRITMNAKFHTRAKQVENTVVYDIMYQNGSAKTDIGKKVHQMFPRNRNSIFFEEKTKPFDNYLVYKPAEVTLKIEELDISYGIKRSVDMPVLFLYPGKKPKMFPLFTNHAKRSRVNGSAYIFSYLTDEVSPQDIVGAPVASNPVAAREVHTVKIEDSDGLITWTPLKTILETDFYKFPQTDVIQAEWQNQNLVPEWFSFKGEYTFSNDYSHIYQENSFTFNNEKFDVRKTRTLKINTGFILKAENDLIDEMIESKLCFLKIGGKIYRAFSVISKLVKEDSALELYQFDLDFLIIEENGY